MARQLMTVEQILSILRDTPERLTGLTGDLTEAKLRAAPEPGEWSSVTEIAARLRSCADVRGQAIETIAVTDHPTIRAVSPTTWVESTDYRELAFASSLQAFRRCCYVNSRDKPSLDRHASRALRAAERGSVLDVSRLAVRH